MTITQVRMRDMSLPEPDFFENGYAVYNDLSKFAGMPDTEIVIEQEQQWRSPR